LVALVVQVDCHALHPDEAVDFCSRAIEGTEMMTQYCIGYHDKFILLFFFIVSTALSERVQSSTSRRHFADLICGTGHHSHDGRSKVHITLVRIFWCQEISTLYSA
jgi:hypothetical protein